MSKAVKEMRLVCRQLLQLHFCSQGLTFGAPLLLGRTKEQDEKVHLQKVYGELCQKPEPEPDWIMFYLWDLTLYWCWGVYVL